MNFNDLLKRQNIDPKTVLMLRHCPPEQLLRDQIRLLAAEKPKIFNAYQQTQKQRDENAFKRSAFVASFVGHKSKKALFVGFYSNHRETLRVLSPDEYESELDVQELMHMGMKSFEPTRKNIVWFDLRLEDFYSNWKGRLEIEWKAERSWKQTARENDFAVNAIHPDNILVPEMPEWHEIKFTYNRVQSLPQKWQHKLEEWRGIYFVIDKSDGKGYIGSAYGEENIYGRWRNYTKTGDGGNVDLRGRKPSNFVFSILQIVSHDLEKKYVIHIENSWKERLHTRKFGLNIN